MISFDPQSLPLARELDRAQERGFRAFLSKIGHNETSPVHRKNASRALAGLEAGLRGRAPDPDYAEPLVAAAYMVKYHLSHCALAYCSFKELFEKFDVPDALYVCDVGAGTGAGRVGLALALSEYSKSPEVLFDACEPSKAMQSAGDYFWESFEYSAKRNLNLEFRSCPEVPLTLPDIPAGALRVVTAFHLSLPWNDYSRLSELTAAQSALRSVLRLVSPDAGLFSCNGNKILPLMVAVDGFPGWDYTCSTTVDIPNESNGASDSSRFYIDCAEKSGFTTPGDDAPVKTWSRHRFSLPKSSVLLSRISPSRVKEKQSLIEAEERGLEG